MQNYDKFIWNFRQSPVTRNKFWDGLTREMILSPFRIDQHNDYILCLSSIS
jgi:hypothetical protein